MVLSRLVIAGQNGDGHDPDEADQSGEQNGENEFLCHGCLLSHWDSKGFFVCDYELSNPCAICAAVTFLLERANIPAFPAQQGLKMDRK